MVNKKMTLAEALVAAQVERFGEGLNEPLDGFLNCEAFESRPDESRMRAFQAAAVIVAATATGELLEGVSRARIIQVCAAVYEHDPETGAKLARLFTGEPLTIEAYDAPGVRR